FHVDHHAWHHARFSTAAAQTHFSLEIRPGFRLISYWKRLSLDSGNESDQSEFGRIELADFPIARAVTFTPSLRV
ncbi:MAG: hypothetical protein OEU68_12525, partial [Nitrospira sp.]|nr:hypothetical protein [Nitrospira sp.]MDH5318150.1 hypothetical protein [Nitrospira sp.]